MTQAWELNAYKVFFFFLLIIAITLGKNALFHTVMSYLWWAIPLLDSTMRVKRAKAALWTEWPARANPVHSTISPKIHTQTCPLQTENSYVETFDWKTSHKQSVSKAKRKNFKPVSKQRNLITWVLLSPSDQHVVFFNMSEKSMPDSSCQSSLIHQIKAEQAFGFKQLDCNLNPFVLAKQCNLSADSIHFCWRLTNIIMLYAYCDF